MNQVLHNLTDKFLNALNLIKSWHTKQRLFYLFLVFIIESLCVFVCVYLAHSQLVRLQWSVVSNNVQVKNFYKLNIVSYLNLALNGMVFYSVLRVVTGQNIHLSVTYSGCGCVCVKYTVHSVFKLFMFPEALIHQCSRLSEISF